MRTTLISCSIGAIVFSAFAACTGSDPDLAPTPPDAAVEAASDDSGAVECTATSDKSQDSQNCGECGHVCGAGFACVDGKCDSDVADVSAGGRISCALLRGGKLYCWGSAEFGLLGEEKPKGTRACSAPEPCRTEPGPIPGLDKVVRFAIGNEHACAIVADGSIKCWGRNQRGQVGPASALPAQPAPVPLPLPVGTIAKEISAAGNTTCAVTAAGEVYCWGGNEDGQVGKPASASEPTPNKVIAGGAIQVALSAFPDFDEFGDGHACAIVGLQVQCWGGNGDGQLGRGTPSAVDPAPAVVNASAGTPFTRAEEIGLGIATSCVRRDFGDVFCWGRNGFGVVPPPVDGGDVAYPTKVDLPGKVTQIATTTWTRLALLDNGDVWGWGASLNGVLANGEQDGGTGCEYDFACTAAPVRASQLPAVAKLGRSGAVALTPDGRVLAWGPNTFGTLGHLPGEQGDVQSENNFQTMVGLKPSIVAGLPPK